MLTDDKATLPSPVMAPPKGPHHRLLSRRVVINAAAIIAGLMVIAVAYTALSLVVGMGLGTGVLYPAGAPLVPPTGSVASILLAAVTLTVPVGALACGHTAYRSTRRRLVARLTREG